MEGLETTKKIKEEILIHRNALKEYEELEKKENLDCLRARSNYIDAKYSLKMTKDFHEFAKRVVHDLEIMYYLRTNKFLEGDL